MLVQKLQLSKRSAKCIPECVQNRPSPTRVSRRLTLDEPLSLRTEVLPVQIYSEALCSRRDCRRHHPSHSGAARLRFSQELYDYGWWPSLLDIGAASSHSHRHSND